MFKFLVIFNKSTGLNQIFKKFNSRYSKKMATSLNNREKISIVWFRNDLRLNDNSALNYAIKLINEKKLDKILPFFCFDSLFFYGSNRNTNLPRCGAHRRNFQIDSVLELKENLIKNLNSNLYIASGRSDEEILKLIEKIHTENENVKVESVIASKEIPSEELNQENNLKKLLNEKKTNLVLVWDQTMIHTEDLPFSDIQKLPDMFTQFRRLVEIRGESNYNVRKPCLISSNYSLPTYQTKFGWGVEDAIPKKIEATSKSTHSAIFEMRGGERAALDRMNFYFFQTDGLKMYKSTRNGLIGKEYSSKLSMWLANGCISARFLYSKVKEFEQKNKPNESTNAFVFELLWRDFFKFYTLKYGKQLFYLNGCNKEVAGYAKTWKVDKNLFEKWCKGETGYPFVDANMKELNETGWMSNRGRQNVASFLTKDLEIDWRMGAEYFEMQLVDFDCGSNWGNWQYVAGVGADPRADRYFNVIKQAYDYDENGDFVKLWLPKLANVSTDFIHCPFRMSFAEQKRFNCVLDKDYPNPVVRTKHEWHPSQRNKVNKFAAKSKKFSD